jgi:CubicO group peptidase (beta-lactamase class C family)
MLNKLMKIQLPIMCIALLATSASADNAPSHSERVNLLFSDYNNETPGCAVAVDRDGESLHLAGYGMADLEQGKSITPESVFYAASVSKQVVAMSALILEQQGDIGFDMPVRNYLPQLPAYAERITTAQLLWHVSGIRDFFRLFNLAGKSDGYVVSEDGIMNILGMQRGLSFEPGERWAYSNSAYFLISQIVKETDGRNLNAFAQDTIFEPLNMQDSRFQHNHRHLIPRKAHGYQLTDDSEYLLSDSTLDVVGSGGMYTTVIDLIKWSRNFQKSTLLGGQAVVDRMETSAVLNSGETTNYGFGVKLEPYRGLEARYHSGSLSGYRAYLMRFPKQNFIIALLCNDGAAKASAIAHSIADIYLAADFPKSIDTKVLPSEATGNLEVPLKPMHGNLTEYEGNYFSEEVGGYQDIVANANNTLRFSAFGERDLVQTKADEFYNAQRKFNLVFSRDTAGNITGFTYNGTRAAGVYFQSARSGR